MENWKSDVLLCFNTCCDIEKMKRTSNRYAHRILQNHTEEELMDTLFYECFMDINELPLLLSTLCEHHQYNKHKTLNESIIRYLLETRVYENICRNGLDELNIRVDLDTLPIKELFDELAEKKTIGPYFVSKNSEGEWYLFED